MKKFNKFLGLVAACSIAVVGCSSTTQPTSATANTNQEVVETQPETAEEVEEVVEEATTVKISHDYGDVEIPKNPQSVVVTDFGILDSLDALGVTTITGVPQDGSSAPAYLASYLTEDYANVGGVKEPNYETLFEVEPDVIFIGGRMSGEYEELSKIAPVVYVSIDTTNYIDSLVENIEMFGEIFAKEAEAEEVITTIKASVEETKALAEEVDVTGLIALVNKGEVSVYGEQSRFGIIHNTLGVTPIDTTIENSTHGQSVTFEYLLDVNPDYLFVVDRNAIASADSETQTAKDTLTNSIVEKMSAAQNDKIIYLDPVAWYLTSGGIQGTEVMISEINAALQLSK